jgi:hypothetical protein
LQHEEKKIEKIKNSATREEKREKREKKLCYTMLHKERREEKKIKKGYILKKCIWRIF